VRRVAAAITIFLWGQQKWRLPRAVGEPTVEAVEENAHKVSLNVFVRATKKNKFKKNNRI
jgi:hypothetical protein